ncbi:hypothetical protein OPQ81_006783 [Rhizoctonia solani]|nr:hypothetical protein OPQ81_006783 [Rhizoctonia solani]
MRPLFSTLVVLTLYGITTAFPRQKDADFDYIIVGSGPAGIVVADRLSEAGKKVLLIERLYWYPQDEDFAIDNNWPIGWQNIEPYVAKLHARLPSTDIPSTDGKRYLTQVYDVFKGVLDAQGYQSVTINNERNMKDKVYGYSAFSSQRGVRTGPMGSYLQTALARPNFELLTYTKVLAVARNSSTVTGVYTNNTAVGNNGLIRLNSKRGRVILSAGTFGSARLLFQSGIGPADALANVEATPDSVPYLPPKDEYLNLPVGYNIQDNPSISLVFSHPSVNAYQNFRPVWFNPNLSDAKEYVETQSGILAQTSPRINWWKKYVGSDSKVRWMQGTASPGNPAGCCDPGLGVSNETLIWVTL